MKVEGPRPGAPATPSRRTDAAGAHGFSPAPAGGGSPRAVSSAAATSAVPDLSAILALQAGDPVLERRARQVRRGRQALAALEQLERALLAHGELEAAARALALDGEANLEPTGEPALDDVLAEIEVRRAVEMAKLESSARRRIG